MSQCHIMSPMNFKCVSNGKHHCYKKLDGSNIYCYCHVSCESCHSIRTKETTQTSSRQQGVTVSKQEKTNKVSHVGSSWMQPTVTTTPPAKFTPQDPQVAAQETVKTSAVKPMNRHEQTKTGQSKMQTCGEQIRSKVLQYIPPPSRAKNLDSLVAVHCAWEKMELTSTIERIENDDFSLRTSHSLNHLPDSHSLLLTIADSRQCDELLSVGIL